MIGVLKGLACVAAGGSLEEGSLLVRQVAGKLARGVRLMKEDAPTQGGQDGLTRRGRLRRAPVLTMDYTDAISLYTGSVFPCYCCIFFLLINGTLLWTPPTLAMLFPDAWKSRQCLKRFARLAYWTGRSHSSLTVHTRVLPR